jgi:uncharacterized SAM-binding protein YcdF (DUF218 family)
MTATPVGDWVGDLLVDVDPLVRADYIVVLGGDPERAVEAARLYREGWAGTVIFSSLAQHVGEDVEIARMYGVPTEAILVDGRARRTVNHPETIALLPGVDREKDRFLLVSGLYDTSRAKACFLRAGYRHASMRAPGWRLYEWERLPRGRMKRARDLSIKVYETLAWGYYKVRGWL